MAEPATREPKSLRSSIDAVIAVYARDVDRTLFERNLKLSHEDRFRQLMELQRFADELRHAGMRAQRR